MSTSRSLNFPTEWVNSGEKRLLLVSLSLTTNVSIVKVNKHFKNEFFNSRWFEAKSNPSLVITLLIFVTRSPHLRRTRLKNVMFITENIKNPLCDRNDHSFNRRLLLYATDNQKTMTGSPDLAVVVKNRRLFIHKQTKQIPLTTLAGLGVCAHHPTSCLIHAIEQSFYHAKRNLNYLDTLTAIHLGTLTLIATQHARYNCYPGKNYKNTVIPGTECCNCRYQKSHRYLPNLNFSKHLTEFSPL